MDLWLPAVILAVVAVAVYYSFWAKRPAPTVAFESEREERLTHRMAQMVDCAPVQALPAVRNEMRIAPDQTDEILLKRAVYHYRQNLPEKVCSVFFDKSPG